MKDSFLTIDKMGYAEYMDQGSKFMAYSYPSHHLAQVKAHLQGIKKAHERATHHCFAFRMGKDGQLFRAMDDGEPSGSAGKVILGQIDNRKLTDILIIVVRYFGGTLLGIPRLTRAYQTSASLVLQVTPVVEKLLMARYNLKFDYTKFYTVMEVIRLFDGQVVEKEMQLFCDFKVEIPLKREIEFLQRLQGIPQVEIIS
ncbi:MAG: IMPACT family protein, partial [Chitinophagaceae bacterium]